MTVDNINSTIDYIDEEKDLGVIVDKQLKFQSHISYSVSKANRMLGLIKRSFKDMNQDVFINLCKSLVRPHIEYCNTTWSPHTVREIRLIEGVQRRATLCVQGLGHLSYEQRLRSLGLPTLEYRRLRSDIIQVYRLFQGIDNISPECFYDISDNSTTRGHQRKIMNGRYNKSIKKYSFAYRVVNEWNVLNNDVVMAHNLNIFKSKLNIAWRLHPLKFLPSFMT